MENEEDYTHRLEEVVKEWTRILRSEYTVDAIEKFWAKVEEEFLPEQVQEIRELADIAESLKDLHNDRRL